MSLFVRIGRPIAPAIVVFASFSSLADTASDPKPDTAAEQPASPAQAVPAEPAAVPASEESAAAQPPGTAAVISATRFGTTIDTAPTNVTVVTAEDIRNSNALNLPDALQQLGGVRVVTGAGTRLDLGGFGETSAQNTLVLINGRRLNDVDISGANLALISLQTVERIEIVRGTSTVLYGDNAVAGVINIVTKSAFEGPTASFFARAGSFATTDFGAQARWAGETVAIVADVNRFASDGYRDYSASETLRATSELTLQRDDSRWGVRALVYRDDSELPGALDESAYKDDASQAGTYLLDTEETQSSLDLFYESTNLAGELAWRDKHQEGVSNFGNRTEADLTTVSLTPRLRAEDETRIGLSRTGTYGADLYRSTLQTRARFPASSFGPATDNSSDVTRDSIALYMSQTYSIFPSVAFGLGLRAQYVGVDFRNSDAVNAVTSRDDHDDLEYGWDLSLQFRYRGGARSHLRVARSFRFAVLDEMWNYFDGSIALLDPQHGRHLEVGGQFPFSDRTQFDASVFRMTLTDEIGYDPAQFKNTNLDPTEHYGADLALKTRPVERWSLRLMHSYRVAKFRSGAMKDMHVPEVPHHTYTAGNTIDLGIAGSLTLDWRFVGKRYFGSDYANDGKQMDSYSRVDAGWAYPIPRGDVRVVVNNVTDEKSADTGYYFGTYSYYPLPDRALTVSVRMEF
jgi:iron complex outermembrane receptor protein